MERRAGDEKQPAEAEQIARWRLIHLLSMNRINDAWSVHASLDDITDDATLSFSGISTWHVIGPEETPVGLALLPDQRQGRVRLTETPGLGVRVDRETMRRYLVPVRIQVGDREIFQSLDL